MKNCPKCNKLFDPTSKWGEKKFCSKPCASSRVWSEETQIKRRASVEGKMHLWCKENPDLVKQRNEKGVATRLQKYIDTPFHKLGPENRRRRVFEEQNFSCNRCKLKEWQGVRIPLELEHKDANKSNNSRENLEGLCPNCHALTPTWRRGANRANNKIMPD